MAEKRYSGAPFGTQTARFDVTGVHPKTKLPGSFTQIPYDKNSMLDLSQTGMKHHVLMDEQASYMQRKFEKQDFCLHNIRESLALASRCMTDIKHIQQMKKNKNLTSQMSLQCSINQEEPEKARNLIENLKESPKMKTLSAHTGKKSKSHFSNQGFNQTLNMSDKILGSLSDKIRRNVGSATKVSSDDFLARKVKVFNRQQQSDLQINVNLMSMNLSGGSSIYAYENDSEPDRQDNEQTEQNVSGAIQEGGESEFAKALLPEIRVSDRGSSAPESSMKHDKDEKDQGKRVSFEDNFFVESGLQEMKDDASVLSGASHKSQGSFRMSLDENFLQETEKRKAQDKLLSATRTFSRSSSLASIASISKVSTAKDLKESLDQVVKFDKKLQHMENTPKTPHTETSSSPQVVEASSLSDRRVANIAGETHEVKRAGNVATKTEVPVVLLGGPEEDQTLPQKVMKEKISENTTPTQAVAQNTEPAKKDSISKKVYVETNSNVIVEGGLAVESEENLTAIAEQPATLKYTLRNIDEIVAIDGRERIRKKKIGSKEILISVPPNSLCNDTLEEVRKKKLSKRLHQPETEACDTVLKRKLGPGAYNTIIGGFSQKNVEEKASGPGWSRQLEVERLAALPHLLHKEQWEENKMLKRKLGPGSYEIKDFIQLANEKPRSGRGICDNLAPRFEKGVQSCTPGPGTYGSGGVPQRALEEKDIKSTSTKGMLDAGDRKRNLPSVGSHLGPGTYQHKTCTDELLNKVTSLKGPYKLYSGDRNKPISEGYLAAPKLANLGPGQYEIGSFVDELNSTPRRTHARFGKMAQYPEVPTDRIFLFSHAHYPKMNDAPGPGAYRPQELSKPQATNSPGFLSSAKRDDKMSQKFFTRNFNPVGAGRYDIQRFEEAQDVNGHTSVFKSKTGKPNLQMGKFLQERIRPKDVAVQDRVFLSQPQRMTRSITVM